MQKKPVPPVSKEQAAVVADTTKSTASRIRFLKDSGFEKADIARIMTAMSEKSVSYQWVKNVLDKA